MTDHENMLARLDTAEQLLRSNGWHKSADAVERTRLLLAAQKAAGDALPVAWIRRHPDGTLTGELLLDGSIEQVRKDSGAWVPLVPALGVPAADGGKQP